ncbi:MAG: DUF3141 domain-containing protein [Sphingomonadaceae bacterium]|nr:DUF3141 domain-containing protein [Sphingomonadaceae bacterium]MDW8415541.1 hypothetical protein [Thermaurantiacus sp.]
MMQTLAAQARLLKNTQDAQSRRVAQHHLPRTFELTRRCQKTRAGIVHPDGGGVATLPARLGREAFTYATDAAHEAAGMPPVLIDDHEIVMDGRDLRRPTD